MYKSSFVPQGTYRVTHKGTLPMLRQYLHKRSAKVQGNREMSFLQIVWKYALIKGVAENQWPAVGVKGWKNEEYAREFEVNDALFDDKGYERLLNWGELDSQKAAIRVQPQTAHRCHPRHSI